MTEYQKKTPHATGSTRQNGAPAISDRQSLTVGSEGPIVLHDTHLLETCLLYTSPSPRDRQKSRMPSSA